MALQIMLLILSFNRFSIWYRFSRFVQKGTARINGRFQEIQMTIFAPIFPGILRPKRARFYRLSTTMAIAPAGTVRSEIQSAIRKENSDLLTGIHAAFLSVTDNVCPAEWKKRFDYLNTFFHWVISYIRLP